MLGPFATLSVGKTNESCETSVALQCSVVTDHPLDHSSGSAGSKGQVEHVALSAAQGFSSTELGLLHFKAAK